MNSVSPHPHSLYPYVKWNKKLFVFQTQNPEVVKVNVTKFSLQFDMFLNIKPDFFVRWGFWKVKGKGKHELFSFFFTYPFNMLQNEHCVYCTLGGVMTISESRFRSIWHYSTHTSHLWAPTARTTTETTRPTVVQKDISDMYMPVWLLCVVKRLKPSCWNGPLHYPATATATE